jgi:hypothetical protein
MPHRKWLRHAHHGIIDDESPCGGIYQNLATTRRFSCAGWNVQTQSLHGIQNTAMHRLQAVADIGQSPGNYNAMA